MHLKRRGIGQPCAYCQRPMEDRTSVTGLAVTRDHYHPKSKGGRKIVLACRTCNSIKKDMLPEDWNSFMESFPNWWEHPEFKDMGRMNPPARPIYVTAWDKNGEPISRYQRPPVQPVRDERGDLYRHNTPRNYPARALKYAGMERPKAIPVEYDDPKTQAAFESIYKDRLHLLRVRPGSELPLGECP